MELKKIEALADILNNKGLSSLEFEEDNWRIKIERERYIPKISENMITFSNNDKEESGTEKESQKEENTESEINFNNFKEIKSPMVGVFYSSPSPDSEPFVKIGDKVKKGDTLCIIEAMKLMNDITSNFDGEIIDICINNGDIAEFSQTLFKIV